MNTQIVTRKELCDIPLDVIYLDGNSLGPLPRSVKGRGNNMIEQEWGQRLIRGWNDAGWMQQPARVGNLIGRLIGAPAGVVVVGDTLSIMVYQALASALEMRLGRKVILTDSGNFPSDLYLAQGLITTLDRGHELRVVAPGSVADSIDSSVAVVMLTEVDYRTGRLHDMLKITASVHDAGAVMIWDLAYSADAIPVDVARSNREFALGCSYKYLNGGPGAQAFIYVRPDLMQQARPALSGWLGHAAPFEFEAGYLPADGIERMRVGTPPVIQMSALEEALQVWEGTTMDAVRSASIQLSERFIAEVEARCFDLDLVSPRDPERRGSQVSFAFEHGYAAMQALIAHGVIDDSRAPDVMRFGFPPLYLEEEDVIAAAGVLQQVLVRGLWRDPAYRSTSAVT